MTKNTRVNPIDAMNEREDHKKAAQNRKHHFAGLDENIGQMPDAEGDLSKPLARVIDTLEYLHRNKRIGDDDLAAGRRFEKDFGNAALDTLRAANLDRVPGGGGDSTGDVVVMARDAIYKSMAALGGYSSPAGCMVYRVLGLQKSIKEFCTEFSFCNGRPLNPMSASGMLIAALSVLAVHYGIKGRSK